MKKIFYLIILLSWGSVNAQTTTTAIKAGFGVDGELRANYFNNFVQSGNDDWFNNGTPGAGAFVIDTTGAASLVAGYANPAVRNIPFYRNMKYPPYSVVNNKLLIDAVFIRDYHGPDTTTFGLGSNKNGMSPASWSVPVAQSVPNKDDILDMMVHVRRAGPNVTDSLWFFGGISIENTSGDRYLDFEMYQTDIYYDRPTQKFYGYGPDAGHTSWKFDAAGNVTRPGDIIFSADYGGSGLAGFQARIWIDNASMAISPANFDWDGTFDGASNGSQFGYAGITPKNAGIFYTGYESPASTWAGPFQLIRGDNSLITTYLSNQFLELSVNLSKLGLDPVTLLGEDACGMPFRRILAKTRSSSSFTSALQDFVGPTDFFIAPRAQIASDQSVLCGLIGQAHISVTNPISTSVYKWTTPNGHIASTTANGDSITVDSAGTYIVTQQLQSGCSIYAQDTMVIFFNSNCFVLNNKILDFNGNNNKGMVQLNWSVSQNSKLSSFEIERSADGAHFTDVKEIEANSGDMQTDNYSATDTPDPSSHVYYRLRITDKQGSISYSKTIMISLGDLTKPVIRITPNPFKNVVQLNISSVEENNVEVLIYDISGKLVRTLRDHVTPGNTILSVSNTEGWAPGVYTLKVLLGQYVLTEKIVRVN